MILSTELSALREYLDAAITRLDVELGDTTRMRPYSTEALAYRVAVYDSFILLQQFADSVAWRVDDYAPVQTQLEETKQCT